MATLITAFWLFAGCAGQPSATADLSATHETAVNKVLDELHAQAAAADFDAYFALYAPNAVFMGTDRSEYWPLEDFKTYSKPRFGDGGGWTYTPLNRELHFFQDTAWFEEELSSENYGRVRGTGVLVLLDGSWKIAQYNLTLPIPNPMFKDVAQDIKQHYQELPKANGQ